MWVDIKDQLGYKINERAEIQGKHGRLLTQRPDDRGCMRAQVNGRPHLVHLLMLYTFVGERPPGAVPKWRNGNPSDNHVNNLEWYVPGSEGVQVRGNRCRNNHVLTRENLRTWGKGNRVCTACERGEPPVYELPEVL